MKKKLLMCLGLVGLVGAPIAVGAAATGVDFISKGAVSYDSNGDGIADTLIDSKDLETINTAIKEAAKSQSDYATELAALTKELDDASSKLSLNKSSLITIIKDKFKGAEAIDSLTSESTFDEIILAINTLSSPSKLAAKKYNSGNNDTTGVSYSNSGSAVIDYSDKINIGAGESVVLPSGYYSSDTTVNNGVKNNGSVVVNFTKASQTANLGAGYYDSIVLNTEPLYLEAYAEGKAQTSYKNVYSTVTINPGLSGKFADGTTATKTFNGPDYKGLDMNIVPNAGYVFDKWEISFSGQKVIMTAKYKDAVLSKVLYDSFENGDITLKDTKVVTLRFNVTNSYDIMKVRTDSRSYGEAYVDSVYEIYVGDELYKTITLSNKGTLNVDYDDGIYTKNEPCDRYYSSTSASEVVTFEKPTGNVRVVCKKANYGFGNHTNNMIVEGY
ncbi:MAG: hypothetical protein K6G84_01825 [Lachnospiraceae bacterium]|nr:hypothetical protein [Lachnospiraceae bacterium]